MLRMINILVILSVCASILSGCTAEIPQDTEIANPASVNCEENGGSLEIKNGENGQYGLCTFDDGSMCEEWAFYKDECETGQVFADLMECKTYFDGCNRCSVKDGKLFACTMMECTEMEEPKCMDNTESDGESAKT